MGRGNPGKVSRLSAAKPSRATRDYAPVTNGKPKPNVVSLGVNRISMVLSFRTGGRHQMFEKELKLCLIHRH